MTARHKTQTEAAEAKLRRGKLLDMRSCGKAPYFVQDYDQKLAQLR